MLRVRLLENRDQLLCSQVACRQQQGVKLNPYLAPGPTDKLRLGDIGDGLDFIVNLGRQPPQHEMVVTSAMEGQRQNRHIIDGVRLDQRLGNPWRDAVKIGCQFLIQVHDRRFRILTDIKSDDQQPLAGH